MFSPVFLAELFVTDSEYISSDNSRLDLDNFCTNAPENDIYDIFPIFYLASCRWPPISREQITMSIRTFLIFLLHFGHCFLFAFVGILFSATPTFVNGNQIILPKTNSSLLQIPLLPTVATENIHSKILSEFRM